MNAVNAMFRDEQEAALDAAVAAANKWVDQARPIINAMFKLDDVASEITRGSSFDPNDYRGRTLREAREEIYRSYRELEKMLEGIRDDFISDQRRTGHTSGDAEANDAFNDALGEETIDEAEAVNIVEREWNAAFDKAASPNIMER